MNRHWCRTRGIDTLVETSDSQAVTALLGGALAGVTAVVAVFRPIIAVARSLDSGAAPELSVVTGVLLVFSSLAAVILSFMGRLRARSRRVAWSFLCALSLIALALSVTETIAGAWFLRFCMDLVDLRL